MELFTAVNIFIIEAPRGKKIKFAHRIWSCSAETIS
jgi:hypothetical protein